MWDAIGQRLQAALGRPIQIRDRTAIGGGCIHQASRLTTTRGEEFFVKVNRADQLPVFEAEVLGLRELAKARALRLPEPVCHGIANGHAFVVLEYISMRNPGDHATLGRQLAELHRQTSGRFGWNHDNFIGKAPQPNGWMDDWANFYRERRLAVQFDLAARNGARFQGARKLMDRLGVYFRNYRPVPSLLHGDLWSGNIGFDDAGTPVIFDPAVYYGDRETDIAMTELFGGFGSTFYQAYRDAWLLDPGYATRRPLYKLYHVLNHFNLFGGGYRQQAQAIIDDLLITL